MLTTQAPTKQLVWFDVFLDGVEIDSIPIMGGSNVEDVRRDLINHDDYDQEIVVVQHVFTD